MTKHWVFKTDNVGLASRVIQFFERTDADITLVFRRGLGFTSYIPDIDKCWVWHGAKAVSKGGGVYGRFFLGKGIASHRASYELFIGPIPDGLELDHLCRNTLCCNPTHLEPVTHAVNVRRGTSMAAINSRKTHCKHGHPLSGDNLYVTTIGTRGCLTCSRRNRRSKLTDPGARMRDTLAAMTQDARKERTSKALNHPSRIVNLRQYHANRKKEQSNG